MSIKNIREFDERNDMNRVSVHSSDERSLVVTVEPFSEQVPVGTDVKNKYFDGYPQVVKGEYIKAKYTDWKVEKDVMIPMRDGVKVAVDVYSPVGEDVPRTVILNWGEWGKDAQDIVAWMKDYPQLYWDSPFWNGSIEGGDFSYTTAYGYIHIIAEPRGLGNSGGMNCGDETLHSPEDIYDAVEWIAQQPWCDGNVVMFGPSSYSRAQLKAGQMPAPHLRCICPTEAPEPMAGEDFCGIFDPLLYNIHSGKHAFDQLPPTSYTDPGGTPFPRAMMENDPETYQRLYDEVLNDPDIHYSLKFYPEVRYPRSSPTLLDDLIYMKHPTPRDSGLDKISVPMYIGTGWNNRLYEWGTFEAFNRCSLTDDQKKLIVYPPMFPARPSAWYHDEAIRWFDYWVKGEDNGMKEEPQVKLFVMGVNKWKFENEWPIARTQWTKFYLQPGGGLSTEAPEAGQTESFTQPAPYIDPKVYCLRYTTEAFEQDMEIIGNAALHFDAALDIDDTNWMVDLVDIAPDGSRQLLSSGALKAKFRALNEEKSTDYRPVHPRQEPVPIVPGEVNRYDIALTPTANVFQKGHKMELVIRNQDDMLGKLARSGVYLMPFLQTVTHTLHLGEAHLVVPVIPKAE